MEGGKGDTKCLCIRLSACQGCPDPQTWPAGGHRMKTWVELKTLGCRHGRSRTWTRSPALARLACRCRRSRPLHLLWWRWLPLTCSSAEALAQRGGGQRPTVPEMEKESGSVSIWHRGISPPSNINAGRNVVRVNRGHGGHTGSIWFQGLTLTALLARRIRAS